MTKNAVMDGRQQRGLVIAATLPIKRSGDAYVVPSQNSAAKYRVDATAKTCSCPDFELRQKPCKHVFAVEFARRRETTVRPDGTTTVTETAAVRITYAQDWPAYNAAASREKELFCHLLHDLCAAVPEPTQERGRPRVPLADALFSACFKVYSTVSSRRFMTDLRDAQANGYVSRAWHFNTVLRVIEDKDLTPTLLQLVTASAAPLKSVESTFAVDSTGFGTQCFYRHYTAKYGREQVNRDYVKLHALIGTKTNVIAACTVTDRDAHDSPQFKPLIGAGAQTFTMTEVSADKAYSSIANLTAVESIGATPYIPFKANATAVPKWGRPSEIWAKLFHFYSYRRDEFLQHYHARSNSESTFSSIKRVFGDTLRSKTMDAQTNELLFKVIAHNIRCLVHSIFELGVTVPGVAVCTQNAVAAPNTPSGVGF